MAEYLIQDTTLINIADAIREKTGKTEDIYVNNFSEEIKNIQTKEDLEEVLNRQDQIITELEEKLDEIGAVDITPEVTENTNLIAQVISELEGKAFVPAKISGQYVWKRYDVETMAVTNPSFIFPTLSAASSSFKLTSNNVNLTTVDLEFFDGFKFYQSSTDSWTLTYSNGELHLIQDSSGTDGGVFTYDQKSTTLSGVALGTHWSTYTKTVTYNGTKTNKLLSENSLVVSDDENTYPEWEEQDGYWYERIVVVVNGIDYGEVTITTSTTYTTMTVTHNLKSIPTYFYVVPMDGVKMITDTIYYANANINGYTYYANMGGSAGSQQVSVTATESTVEFRIYGTGRFNWFAMA